MRPPLSLLFRCGLLLASLLMVACGFRLARELQLPVGLSNLRLETPERHGILHDGLRDGLRRAGASIVSADDGAGVLRVRRAGLQQRALSVSAAGRVQEFELVYRAEFELHAADGTPLLSDASVELVRDYSFNSAAALGTPGEDELLREELEREAVSAILRRIDMALR